MLLFSYLVALINPTILLILSIYYTKDHELYNQLRPKIYVSLKFTAKEAINKIGATYNRNNLMLKIFCGWHQTTDIFLMIISIIQIDLWKKILS